MTLLASYSFDVGSGSEVADTSGNNRDLTLTANGSWVAGHTLNSVGVVTTSQAAASGLVNLPGLTAFTVMGWMKVQFTGSYASTLMVDDGAGSKHIRMGRGGFGSFHFETITDEGMAWVWTADGLITAGNWYHFAVRWDGLNTAIFVDGVSSVIGATGSATVGGTMINASRLLVGGDQGEGTSTWDDVRLYNEALNQATITTLMNEPVRNSGIYFADGSEVEAVYLWNGTSLIRTGLIKP